MLEILAVVPRCIRAWELLKFPKEQRTSFNLVYFASMYHSSVIYLRVLSIRDQPIEFESQFLFTSDIYI